MSHSRPVATILCAVMVGAFRIGSERASDNPGIQPAWADASSLATPSLFALNEISTPDDEMDASFSPDGRTLYFTKNHFGQRLGVILESHFERGRWSPPAVASFSGQFTDYDPFVTADGAKLFFASNRPLGEGLAKKDFDIWFVERTPKGWTVPRNAGTVVNTAMDEFYPSLAADGTLYFSATRPDSLGRSDIYRARWRAEAFQAPENLGPAVNSAAQEVDSYTAPDQSFIVFAGFGRPDDLGNGDLYISEQRDGVWTPARHLGGGINSAAREYCPAGSPDGKYFFFTSFRGFGDHVPARPWTFAELRAGLDGVLNGWGNIYRVDMGALRKP